MSKAPRHEAEKYVFRGKTHLDIVLGNIVALLEREGLDGVLVLDRDKYMHLKDKKVRVVVEVVEE